MSIKIRSIAIRPLKAIAGAFAGEPATFSSDLPSAQALGRLRKLISWTSAPYMLGSVSVDVIKLRTIPTGNFVNPNPTCFYGHLHTHGEGSVLIGSFKAIAFRRCVGGVFLLFLAFMFLCGAVEMHFYIVAQASNLLDGLVSGAFLVLWLTLVSLFAWFVAWNVSPVPREIESISTAIRQALQPEKSGPQSNLSQK